jgi:predicted Fe-S protein YdhL (DUF1289 family)
MVGAAIGRAAMESPCVKICTYQPGAGICLGCGRTLAEIAGWTGLSDAERRQIMEALPARLAKLKKD